MNKINKMNKMVFKNKPFAWFIWIGVFFQTIIWLHYFEIMTYGHEPIYFGNVISFLILSIAAYVFIKLLLQTAPKWLKYFFYIFIFLISVNIFLGFLNKYGRKHPQHFSDSDTRSIPNSSLLVLFENNEIIVQGKKSKRVEDLYLSGEKIENLSREESLQKYHDILIPPDFNYYQKLIMGDTNNAEQSIVNFYNRQYPGYIIYISFKKLKCIPYSGVPSQIDCNVELNELWKSRSVDPILYEIVYGGLGDRLNNFYNSFKDVFFPTYITTEYKDDPYFLIHQGKYDLARKNLSKLPQDRREFCERKLDSILDK